MANTNRSNSSLLPRLVRLRDAPFYLGMDRNRFNAEVRPHLTEIPIGTQGIAFDRLDLDVWVDEYKTRNGRAGKGDNPLCQNVSLDSSSAVVRGTSTKSYSDNDYLKIATRIRER